MAVARKSKVVTLSLPPEYAADFEKTATEEGRTRSELFREMMNVYRIFRESGTFESLQRYGASRARPLGVRDEQDVERLILEYRRSR